MALSFPRAAQSLLAVIAVLTATAPSVAPAATLDDKGFACLNQAIVAERRDTVLTYVAILDALASRTDQNAPLPEGMPALSQNIGVILGETFKACAITAPNTEPAFSRFVTNILSRYADAHKPAYEKIAAALLERARKADAKTPAPGAPAK